LHPLTWQSFLVFFWPARDEFDAALEGQYESANQPSVGRSLTRSHLSQRRMKMETPAREENAQSAANSPRFRFRSGRLLAFAAVGEGVFGCALTAVPSIGVRALLGGDISATGSVMSRFAGIALISLGLACWPDRSQEGAIRASLRGMLVYSVIATVYLGWLAFAGATIGFLLWPAVAVHFVLTLLLLWTWSNQ
jgi:hypothetical protein